MGLKNTIVIDDDALFPISIAKKVGIFYEVINEASYDFHDIKRIHLFTLCYRPRQKDFVKKEQLDLPKKLRDRYENVIYSDEKAQELESINIHNYYDIFDAITLFNDYQERLALNQYRSSNSDNDLVYQKMLELKSLVNGKQTEGKQIDSKQMIKVQK